MSNLRKSLLIIFCLFNVVWLLLSQTRNLQKISIDEKNINFHALLSNVNWSEYDAKGIISHQFYAPLVKNISNKLNIIYSPKLRLQNENTTWQIQARFAKTINGLDSIELSQNVKIKHLNKQSLPTCLQTEKLLYNPKTQVAHTKEQVTFTQGNNIIHSLGMNANFSNSTSIKLGKVNGIYHPEHTG